MDKIDHCDAIMKCIEMMYNAFIVPYVYGILFVYIYVSAHILFLEHLHVINPVFINCSR